MKEQNSRRTFFKYLASGTAALGAASAFGKSINLDAEAKEGGKKPHYGMIFDQNKCVGCTDCEIACRKVNLVPKGQMRLFIQDRSAKFERKALCQGILSAVPGRAVRERVPD